MTALMRSRSIAHVGVLVGTAAWLLLAGQVSAAALEFAPGGVAASAVALGSTGLLLLSFAWRARTYDEPQAAQRPRSKRRARRARSAIPRHSRSTSGTANDSSVSQGNRIQVV